MSQKILLSGYYGFGNTGDEAVLSGILSTLRECTDAEITVLSSDPERTVREHNVRAAHRYKQLFSEVAKTDLLISGGGSLLQDITSGRSIYYYLGVLRLAQMLGKKTLIYAQGIGPILSPRAGKAVAKAVNKAKAVTVRDGASARLLNLLGVKKNITVIGDPAFVMGSVPYKRKDFIAVSVRHWKDENLWIDRVRDGLTAASAELNMPVIVLPMQKSDDIDISERLGFEVERNLNTPEEVKGFFASSSVTAAMRLHSLIFAASGNVPFVPLSYDVKVSSFAAMFDINGPDIAKVTADKLCDAVVSACRDSELRGKIKNVSDKLCVSALSGGNLVKVILEQQ